MTTEPVSAVGLPAPGAIRRVVAGASIGNFVEWLDFGVYAALTPIIASNFFPAGDRTAALLGTFAIYAVAFFARPVGGFVFGHLGDTLGRRNTLAVTILLMSGATCVIGLLPTYASVGVLAPLLLVLCRLVQGFAVGGEYMGAATFIVEYAPPHREGFYASFVSASLFAGPLAAIALTAALTAGLGDATMLAWGWRLPFLLALPLGLIGLYLRLRFDETPDFEAVKAHDSVTTAPIKVALRTQGGAMAVFFGVVIANVVGATLLIGYLPAYLVEATRMSRADALLSNVIMLAVMVVACPLSGVLADRFGRKPLLAAAAIGFVVLSVPGLMLAGSGGLLAATLGQIVFAAPVFFACGAQPLALVEAFPAHVRYTAGAVTYGLVNMIFGGTGPLVSTALLGATRNVLAPAYYLAALGLIAAAVVLFAFKENPHARAA